MTETRDTMIRRLRMRSMRRGIKEMDLILSAFASQHLDGFDADTLALYDDLLSENDHDIYAWILGTATTPAAYADLVDRIARTAEGVTRPMP